MRVLTGGINRIRPIRPRTTPKPASPMVCTRNSGCLGMRTTLKKHIAAKKRNVTPGKSEKISFQVEPPRKFGNGRSHPPSHNVTAIDETAIIAEYSAKKNNDHRNPLYSV